MPHMKISFFGAGYVGVVVVLITFVSYRACAAVPPCSDKTTLEMETCLVSKLHGIEERLQRYMDAATKRIGDNGASGKLYGAPDDSAEILDAFRKGAAAWTAYRSAACDAVYASWATGTIRGAMALACEIRITEERTHEVWRDWLTYMDRTPPVLPEPTVETGADP